jgi:hypothetical protein
MPKCSFFFLNAKVLHENTEVSSSTRMHQASSLKTLPCTCGNHDGQVVRCRRVAAARAPEPLPRVSTPTLPHSHKLLSWKRHVLPQTFLPSRYPTFLSFQPTLRATRCPRQVSRDGRSFVHHQCSGVGPHQHHNPQDLFHYFVPLFPFTPRCSLPIGSRFPHPLSSSLPYLNMHLFAFRCTNSSPE